MKKAKTYAILLCLFSIGLFLISCNDSSKKNENVQTEVTENDNDGYVNLKLDDGSIIEIKSLTQSGGRSLPSKFHASLSGKGIIVILQLSSTDGPIKEGKYGDVGLGITVKNLNGEEYRSFYYKNKDTGKEGEAETTITSIGEKHVTGIFSGTLYSKSGKKTTIEGKFATIEKKK